MDLESFRQSILQEVHVNASQNGTFPRDEFLALYTEELVEAEEFVDFEPVQYDGSGSRNKHLQIDGYYYDDLEQSLGLFICDFSDSEVTETVTRGDAETSFRREEAFVQDALSGFIQKHAEESSPGYGLAVDISGRYKDVRKYKFYLITDKVLSKRITGIPGGKLGKAETEYSIWDISRLQGIRESKTGKEDIVIHLSDFGVEGIPCLKASESEDYTAYLCNIPGKVLADMYNHYGSRLLEGNVRSFLSVRGKINKGIRNTILNDPAKFFAYNNGIAATAYAIQTEQGFSSLMITEITGLQIVNGGQTTASLANALIKDKARANNLQNIYVPMKLSVVSPENAVTLIPDIARFANSQNKVSEADFFSNSPFHIRMEEISRRLIAPAVDGNQFGTHWYYERARGQYRQEQAKMTEAEKKKFQMENPKRQMFTKTDLAKYYNIYQMMPDKVSLGAQKNFIEFAKWAGEQWNKNDLNFNEVFFKRVVCVDILFKAVDDIVKHAAWYDGGYKAQVNTYTLSWLFYLIQKNYPRYAFNFRDVWNKQRVSDELKMQLESLAEKVFYHLTNPDRLVQNVTEWAKRADCWEKLKEIDFQLSPALVRWLVPKEAVSEQEKDAKVEQKEISKANAMIQVANYGVENWKKVQKWGIENNIFSATDLSFLKAAIAMEKGKFPTDRQCVKILGVLQKARDESYPD